MSRNKLTKNQKRRIEENKARTLANYSKRTRNRQHDWQEDTLGEIQEGRVVARYSLHADVESLKGDIFRCNLRRTVSDVVVGDYVLWREGNEISNGINGVIEAVKPRHNVLTRPDYYDGIKSIAANIDQIFIVSSVLPQFSTNIIDRYIVVCEQLGITPIIIVNKIDLCSHAERQAIERTLFIYQDIGYQTLLLSSQTKENLDQFTALLTNRCSILVGQSGVGKSSLLNTVDPKLQLQTGDISINSGLGQHTTTVSRLLKLTCGGEVIDSPGVREFGLWHLDAETITRGYREFHPYLGQCKFRDCKHLDDPECALQSAVQAGAISIMRFENYHRLITALEENRSRRHFSTR